MEIWPAHLERRWKLVTDDVMGGVSTGSLVSEHTNGRGMMRMGGHVSTENNGGFIQISLDLAASGEAFDASRFQGIEIEVAGNNETYGVHLRTTTMTRPQQSYRQSFAAKPQWQTLRLPFDNFTPHRIEDALDTARLRRIGLIAIGREVNADLSVARLSFY